MCEMLLCYQLCLNDMITIAFQARKENTALTTKHNNNKKEEEIKQI